MIYLNHLDIVHRDLKTENIMIHLSKENELLGAKIIDFGTALKVSVVDNEQNTQEKILPEGTIDYMAPEVFEGTFFNELVDVYSYGIILWAMMACKEPCINVENIYQIQPEQKILILSDALDKLIVSYYREYQLKEIQNLIIDCINYEPRRRPSFQRIFERLTVINIMKNSKEENINIIMPYSIDSM